MERLYYKDAYISKFNARVISITEKGIVLDKTAFFPEGGGQSSDTGTLGNVKISDVQEENGVIYHKTQEKTDFSEGDTVEGIIDFSKRFSDMQNHSGEHIVSGIVHSVFGYENVGFHLNDKEIALDFSGVIPSEKISEIELMANETVWKNLEIKAFFPSEEEKLSINYRSKKEIDGELRLVEIEGVDICACCAPHVRRTGEIGIIKIVGFEKHRGGTRVYILCGERALKDYSVKQEENHRVGTLLKVKEYETSSAVEALIKKKNDFEYEITKLNNEAAVAKASAYEESESIIAFESFTGQALVHFANTLKEKAKFVATFTETGENNFQYMIISDNEVTAFVREMNTALNGKGGGRGGSARGSLCCSEEEIRTFFIEKALLK